jgi:predicted MPP superfamily phosphohydrolase
MLVIAWSTFFGRFNFKTEEITINIKGLDKNLDGFKIVQISDLHLPAFHNKSDLLEQLMTGINSHNPDIVTNTGDFISYGWGEFGRTDTILSKAKGKYGNFAVLGNHDIGTYHPTFSDEEIAENISQMFKLIAASGYLVLDDENVTIDVAGKKIAILGIRTSGRHPDMIHGNLTEAMSGLRSVDLKILLAHDPNQWEIDVQDNTDIDVTLSGHTHGMQMGIYTEKFKWSPAKYFYPHWGGLFKSGDQYHYVNRGLGMLVIPFRIWMPPEITVITLKSE